MPAEPRAAQEVAVSQPKAREPKHFPRYRIPWAELLAKVFAVDVLACPKCPGRLEIIAFIADPMVARRILEHLGLDSDAPPLSRARGPPEEVDPGPDYGAPDPVYEE